jgi:hypothetical protein
LRDGGTTLQIREDANLAVENNFECHTSLRVSVSQTMRSLRARNFSF